MTTQSKSELTPAEAWCWCARLLTTEGSELQYAWPPTETNVAEAGRLYDQADACHRRAAKLDSDPELYQRALAKWDDSISVMPIDEAPVFQCPYCRADVAALRDVDAGPLGIPVRRFCEPCAVEIEREIVAQRVRHV